MPACLRPSDFFLADSSGHDLALLWPAHLSARSCPVRNSRCTQRSRIQKHVTGPSARTPTALSQGEEGSR